MKTPIDPARRRMVEQLDLDLREIFEERAGIIEYDAAGAARPRRGARAC